MWTTTLLLIAVLPFLVLLTRRKPQQRTRIHAGSRVRRMLSKCPSVAQGYRPVGLWGTNGHLQSVWAMVARTSPRLSFPLKRITLVTPDNGTVAVDVSEGDLPSSAPIVVIVPGIAGSSDQHYVRNVVECCNKRGWRAAVFIHRGCGKLPLTSPRLFAIGDCEDLLLTVEYLRDLHPGAPMLGVGFSMGGNILLNFLAHNNGLFAGGVTVSAGYDVGQSCKFIPVHRPYYNRFLAAKLQSVLKRHKHVFSTMEKEVGHALGATCVTEFDRVFTCKVLQYESPQLYYTQQSCWSKLHKITTPILLVNAADDPVIPEEHIEPVIQICKNSENIGMAVPQHGGHLSFAEGRFWPNQESWMDRAIIEFLQGVLEDHGLNQK